MEEKIKEEKRFFERIMTWIPGFKGYKEKELRRESDKLLRTSLHQRMESLRARLFEVYREIIDKGMAEIWEEMDRIISKIDLLSERINHASYGYTGFFDIVKVDEKKLDRMITFDYTLIEKINDLSSKVDKITALVREKDEKNIKQELINISNTLSTFEEYLSDRKNEILGILES